MREICFRGFHPSENGTQEIWTDGTCNGEKVKGRIKGEWIEGYFFKIWHEYYILWGTTNDIPNMLEVLPETVGMWTGLTDKNGRRIFEGDIVRYPCGAEYEVFYDSETMSFRLKNETDIHCFDIEANLDMEIIGTIFDKEEK